MTEMSIMTFDMKDAGLLVCSRVSTGIYTYSEGVWGAFLPPAGGVTDLRSVTLNFSPTRRP